MVRRSAVAMAVSVCCAVTALTGAAPANPGFASADLVVVSLPTDPDPVSAGGTTTVHAFVANQGPDEAGSFTVTVSLPDGASPQGPYFPTNCAVLPDRNAVSCTFQAGLPSARTATALVPVQIAPDARGDLTGGRVTVSSDGDPNADNDSAPFIIHVTG